ncbi:MAG: hypothetical protein ACPGES_04330 [Coraliomargarita sp.]
MKLGKFLSDTFNAAPSIVLIGLGIIVFFQWSERSMLVMEVEDLTLRELHLTITDSEGNALPEASIGIEPSYSFDEIKPKYQLTILGKGSARLSVVFAREFKIQAGASGYKSRTIKFRDSDPTELNITLQPISSNGLSQ